MRRPFSPPICSSPFVVPLMLLACFTPLYGNSPGRGAIEIAGSISGSHSRTTSDREEDSEYSRGTFRLDFGVGYFFTDVFEFQPRIEWASGTYRQERGYNYDFGRYDGYGVSGLFFANRATEHAGILFLGVGGGVAANGGWDIEPVRLPILEAGTRVLLGSSASLNVTAFYERRRYDYGRDDATANSYGLKMGFSFFPLPPTGNKESGR